MLILESVFYLKNGISINELSFIQKHDDMFYIESVDKNQEKRYSFDGDSLLEEIDLQLVSLYDRFRDLFFIDKNQYYFEYSILPNFICNAGYDSDCALTKTDLIELLKNDDLFLNIENRFKHLYFNDCCFLIRTIQNLMMNLQNDFINYYVELPNVGEYSKTFNRDGVFFEVSNITTNISNLVDNYFIRAYSILDLFCKIATEIEFPEKEFVRYKKLNSSKKIWGDRKNLKINGSIGTIFEKCETISIIEYLRNEIVHNGTWEFSPKVFVVCENFKIIERFMLFPDIEQGRLATLQNRKHFFGDGIKVNDKFVEIHFDFFKRIFNTLNFLLK